MCNLKICNLFQWEGGKLIEMVITAQITLSLLLIFVFHKCISSIYCQGDFVTFRKGPFPFIFRSCFCRYCTLVLYIWTPFKSFDKNNILVSSDLPIIPWRFQNSILNNFHSILFDVSTRRGSSLYKSRLEYNFICFSQLRKYHKWNSIHKIKLQTTN